MSLHVYDLTAASPLEKADVTERRAKREFEVVRRFQKSPHLPGLVDTWQTLPNYDGEMFFFTLAESASVRVAELVSDTSWGSGDRLAFAAKAFRALSDLQAPDEDGSKSLVHRNLTPDNTRVKASGAPLFGDGGGRGYPIKTSGFEEVDVV